MKKCQILFAILLILVAYTSQGQNSSTPDSVCAGANGKSYKVIATTGNTCHWSLTGGGMIHTTYNSDSILIDWSSVAGTDTIKVVESNPIGCLGDTVSLAVVRLPIPNVVLSGSDSICLYSASSAGKILMNLTGISPWTISYLEDGITRTVITSSNPYTFDSQVYNTPGVKFYSLTSISGRLGCIGTKSGTAAVTVFPKPSTSSISHY